MAPGARAVTVHDVADAYTPYVRGALGALPLTERRVLVALLRSPDPLRMTVVAAETRMEPRVTSVALGRLRRRGGLVSRLSLGIWHFADPWMAMTYRAWRWRSDMGRITAGIPGWEKLLADAPTMLARRLAEARAEIDRLIDEAEEGQWAKRRR